MNIFHRHNIVFHIAATAAVFAASRGAASAQTVSVKAPQKAALSSARVVSEVYLASVERVIDGNTLVVQPDDPKEKKQTIHLFGVIAPRGTEAQAKEAREFLQKSAQGKRVRVETRHRNQDGSMDSLVSLLPPPPPRALLHMEPTGIRPDMPRGRETMGTASSALLPPEIERNVNYGLVRAGLARRHSAQIQGDKALNEQFASAESDARREEIGLWLPRSKAAKKP